jgi:hypothetical protein
MHAGQTGICDFPSASPQRSFEAALGTVIAVVCLASIHRSGGAK